MSSAIDAKDPYTRGHSDRVARVSVRLCQELGSDQETIRTIYLAGLLHDVGKIGIDDNVLRKPGPLTPTEFEHIKTHPELGCRILEGVKQLDMIGSRLFSATSGASRKARSPKSLSASANSSNAM